MPSEFRLFAAMDATWPAAEMRQLGPWTLRRGLGGGKRVSAATTKAEDVEGAAINDGESAMRRWGQEPVFMLRAGNAPLDDRLDALGYRLVDPVLLFAGNLARIAAVQVEPLDAIPSVEPLAIMRELWKRNGIGISRVAVMARARGPKTHLFSRHRDAPAGCAFVAVDGDVAMLHALAVDPPFRRDGVARRLMARAATWAGDHGARIMAVATTGDNLPAQSLFRGLGMEAIANYHYRLKRKAWN
ncbi:MAG: GNAT family N-acetyltransferase [Paracoccaceae bacterium]